MLPVETDADVEEDSVGYEGYTRLHVEIADGVATVLLDNPPINLFDFAFVTEVGRVAAELEADDDVRAIVLRSAVPGFFIAHFDATVIRSTPSRGAEITERRSMWTEMCERYRTMPKATIALINGRCGGGGLELALSCDMRFAARETSYFNQWEVAIGLLAGGGGMTRLARLMGRSRALEMVLGCDDIDADVAERYGVINRALPEAELDAFVARLAGRIASFPPYAVAATKACVLRVEKDVVADLHADHEATAGMIDRPEARAAIARFLELGGQTVEGEMRFGDLLGELSS